MYDLRTKKGDTLCFFHCLERYRTEIEAKNNGRAVNRHRRGVKGARKLCEQWCAATGQDPRKFKGVLESELDDLEKLFHVNIYVYILDDLNQRRSAILKRRPVEKLESRSTMYLHLENDHFELIKDMNMYAQSYICKHCPVGTRTSPQDVFKNI